MIFARAKIFKVLINFLKYGDSLICSKLSNANPARSAKAKEPIKAQWKTPRKRLKPGKKCKTQKIPVHLILTKSEKAATLDQKATILFFLTKNIAAIAKRNVSAPI